MRAILLAGGHATRLWPITKDRPKPLLPIGDTTLLERLLDQLEPVVSEVLVSSNELFADQFAAVLRERPKARLTIEEQASEEEKPGALGAILQLIEREGLEDDEPLLVAGGDNYYGFDLAEFHEQAASNDGPTVAVKDVKSKEQATQFGIVELADGTRIEAFHEKPEDPPSTLAATALYHYPAGWRDLFDRYRKAAEGSPDKAEMMDAPGRILEWAVAQGQEVHAWGFTSDWFDIGTPDGYLEALDGILGDRYIEGSAEGCELGEGVYIFPGAQAEDSQLSRTILLPEAQVRGSTLDRCIVDAEAQVIDVDLEGSLVGTYTRVAGA